MLINKFVKTILKNSNFIITKNNKKLFSSYFNEDQEEELKFKDKESRRSYEEWKRKNKLNQDNEMMRIREIVRNRQEESKKSNKEYLLKMKIPGIKEEVEKYNIHL
jgi:hypothetical protein